jgi:predicted nucleic acid-binding protein
MRLMVPQNFLLDPNVTFVLDTSVIINLNASDYGHKILHALPNRIFVSNEVLLELEEGRQKGCNDADFLNKLVSADLAEIKNLNDTEIKIFEQMVIGPAGMTLDDGESATVAYAVENHAIAVIDERKAHRICREQFPSLIMGCTIDLFTHPAVQKSLELEELHISIKNALSKARMRVFPEYIDWIIDIIGPENVNKYTSLPRFARLSVLK